MPRDDLCGYGRGMALERLNALLAEVEGVRDGEDLEHVHRMRVSSRRLRSALRLFQECFKGKEGKRWRQAAKEVTAALGEARDLDVQMVFLTKLAKGWEGEDAAALVPLIELLRSKRVALQPSIVTLMDALLVEHPLLELRAHLEEKAGWTGEASALRPYAYAHASIAVEEMMAHASSVPIYEDWQGHHALRIAGKHLRYALEAFRGAYEDGLEEEVRTLKGLQDVVGELHDLDVWLQLIPSMREDAPQAALTFDRLQTDLEGQRRALHGKLVESWSGLQQDRFFYRLLDKLKGGTPEEVCPLKVALISDVHGNEAALRAVLEHARERGVTAVLNAGDAVGAPRTDEVIDLLRGTDVLSVQGNLDQNLVLRHKAKRRTEDPQLDLTMERLRERSWEWLAFLPQEVRLDICGRTVYMTHAAPGEMTEKLLPTTPEAHLKAIAQKVRADVIVIGHTHVSMCRDVSRTMFVNPGSVGRPRDGPDASYAILEFPSLELQHHRVRYDVKRTVEEVRSLGLVDLAAVIEKGRNEDRVTTVSRWAMTGNSDQDHLEQVRTLVLQLFDQTKGLHRLGGKERELLEMAALAHDVGLRQGAEGHQRRALDLIMEADLPLPKRDKMMVACIARYHGCRSPRDGDRVYKELGSKDRKRVRKMAALLALADALDRAHACSVCTVRAAVGRTEVSLRLEGDGALTLEREWVGHKKCQFEQVFKRRLCLEQ